MRRCGPGLVIKLGLGLRLCRIGRGVEASDELTDMEGGEGEAGGAMKLIAMQDDEAGGFMDVEPAVGANGSESLRRRRRVDSQ